ncbi:TSL-kinase interacting protein 1 [Rutidosis leptorrhynchoides]|uniref:TSL-kinase interacting protein 1 n=1 Tax=Rutidosis leptorrhynchoides TaxID=125765 RepID=UPI003A9A49EC
MESQVSCHEASDIPENVFIKDVITSETHHVASDQPAKKQTRQWAAWTRQEEESFFNALRQVGKNFEKITARVQSKNKDQVRHYYYRLVRRMNKLLGPELYLDAKNHKETNAAMLRWWSLLEKHSCKASKLHLKPRRFKIFLETLEHQLLKDRKKNIKKRPLQAENCSVTSSNPVLNQGKACTHDTRVNLVLVDGQPTQNASSAKGVSLRRNASTCLDRNNCKGDLSSVKQARQRRRPGSAAYKKWEKAAIAGVSLVADAAAHLEQTALDKLVDSVEHMHGDNGLNSVAREIPPVPSFHHTTCTANNVQPLTKLKLQLFPVNESIRRALEMDNHNPHLELTLSCRKKISSVLEHMNRKWGTCSIASGELMLLPYYAESVNLMNCPKWTQNSVLSAADVYASIGSPSVFRLRYGWFANTSQEPQSSSAAERLNMNGLQDKGSHKNAAASVLDWADSLTNISVGDLLADVSHGGSANCIPSGSQIPFSCDSFDAAIAAHISKNLGNNTAQPTVVSSIWDAEDTCDAFTFRKNYLTQTSIENCEQESSACPIPSGSAVEKTVETDEPVDDYPAELESMDEGHSDPNAEDGSAKDQHDLTDIYWPDSLGPLEVEMPPCRYQSNDLILSESFSGLSRILASSLDAFQNCSFFGLEQRDQPIEDREVDKKTRS